MNLITETLSWMTDVPECNIRLFLTVLLAYPIGYYFQQEFIIRRPNATPKARNNYIFVSGFCLAVFFNGYDIYHSLITIYVSYYLCYLSDQFHIRRAGAFAVWIFNAVYLLSAYYNLATDEYDIGWLTTQCVLCLRLMGFSSDFMDGAVTNETSNKKEITGVHSFASDSPLRVLPQFKEFLGYCYFPSAFLIGPQFSFSLYKRFLSGPYNGLKLNNKEYTEKIQLVYVLRCVAIGLFYIAVLQLLGAFFPTSYTLTPEYAALPLWKRFFAYWICGKLVYVKYIGVWLLTEGASAYFGITYQGVDDFSGLANVKPLEFEFMTSIEYLIPTFNINTNLWVKQYVFKRLRFLGNKDLSQLGALLFLALWHGFHYNYFETFLLEFVFIYTERLVRARYYKPIIQPVINRSGCAFYAWKLVAWFTAHTLLNYAIVGFDLLTFSKGFQAYTSVYWFGHIIPLFTVIILLICKGPNKDVKSN